MEMNVMSLAAQLHTPEELRMLSNYAHWVEGGLFFTAALMQLFKVRGRIKVRKADLLWQGLIFGAGVFLTIYLFFHHPLDQFGLVWQIILNDPQQRQHVSMALLLTLVAAFQLFYTTKRLRSAWIPYTWPLALGIIGILFILHPQHGTAEAIAYMKPYHTLLGTTFLLGGITSALAYKNPSVKKYIYMSLSLLFLSSVILLMYREPDGAYMMDMSTLRQNISSAQGEP